jgi:hypothetical protein
MHPVADVCVEGMLPTAQAHGDGIIFMQEKPQGGPGIPLASNPALAVPVPQVPVAVLSQHNAAVPAVAPNAAVPTAEMIFSQHMQQAAAANAANVLASAPPGQVLGTMSESPDGTAEHMQAMHASEAHETQTKYTGVRRNKGGRFSARIKLGGVNRCAPIVSNEEFAFSVQAI